MASYNGIWYRCKAEDVSKTVNSKTIITNACNNGTPTDNTTSWLPVGDASTVDLTPPIFATAWNENLNFKIGDYYADSAQQKIFKCIGNDPTQSKQLRNAEVLCRQKYDATTIGGWKDVTSTVPFDQKYMDYKHPLTYYQGWFKDARYLQGDVIFDWSFVPWICKADTCDTADPSDAAQTAWSAFDLTSMTANKANWAQYDVGLYNYIDAPESPYTGFNEGVICKAPTVDPLAFGDRVCDASTVNVP
jgi:hypothetical protein